VLLVSEYVIPLELSDGI